MERRRIYHFGPFGLDAVAKVLLRGNETLHLTRKAAETLLILADRCPQVVTKEELLEAVWPDRVVDETNLAQNIAVIRKTLAASKGDPAYIETFSGRGYRLTGPVSITEEAPHPSVTGMAVDPADPPAPPPPPRTSTWRWVLAAALALAAAGVFYLSSRSDSPPAPPHIAPFTRLAGKESQPAFSPDGSKVAYLWEEGAGQTARLCIQGLSDSNPTILTKGSDSYSSPAWSPDGRSLAALRFRSNQAALVLLPIDGGAEKELTRVLPTRYGLAHRHLDWSPDGSTLVLNDASGPSEPLALYLIDAQTGGRRRLTTPEEFLIGDLAPRFSPDGKRIAFIRAAHRSRMELYLVAAKGGEPEALTNEAHQISDVQWLAGELLYASNKGGEFRIWRTAQGKKPIATGVYGDSPLQLTLSPRDHSLIYTVIPNDPNIWRLDFGPPSKWQRVIASTAQDVSPQYSPDGERIAFRSDRSGAEEIWVASADGTNPIQVTHGELAPSVARWSPDGRQLVLNDTKNQQLYLAQEDGGRWRIQPRGVQGVHPVFTPDGQSLLAAFARSVLRIPAAGGSAQTLLNERSLSLGLSPDGRYLYYVHEPAATSLWRTDLNTKKTEQILDGLVPYCTSCWAPAPNGIYYLGARLRSSNEQSLYFKDFQTNTTRLVADYPEPILPLGIGPFSLSPDGKSLLVVRLDPSNADLQRVERFP